MSDFEPELVYAHFFFVDVVGLSNPTNSTKIQLKKLNILHDSIKECKTFMETQKEDLLFFPSGDGLALGFFKGPHQPLKLAIELQEKLSFYNKGKVPSEIVEVRIGLNSGNVFCVNGIFNEKSIWGPGIIIARRVMDFGDSGHILMAGRMAEELSELSIEYKNIFHRIEDLVIKHGKSISVFSVYGQTFGNHAIPKKAKEQGIRREFVKTNEDTLYPKIKNEITILEPKTMLTHHKRFYEVKNVGDKPIKSVIQGIGTDVKKKSLEELKVKVYDENNQEMEIDFITMNYPYQKEFTTKFNTPILKNDMNRAYTLEFEVEEPEQFYENFFQVDCKHFELIFHYPENSAILSPILYDVNSETDEATESTTTPFVEIQNGLILSQWVIDNIQKGKILRIEW
jgi:hypothetical protein